jgi:hypothetical protein
MRASHLAVMVTVLALPSAAYAQDSSQETAEWGRTLTSHRCKPALLWVDRPISPSPGARPARRLFKRCPARPGRAR